MAHTDKKILIVCSEELMPDDSPLAGIFQFDQAKALLKEGFSVTIISVSLIHSSPMMLKAIVNKFSGKSVHPAFQRLSTLGLIKLWWQKLISAPLVKEYQKEGINIITAEAFMKSFYLKFPSEKQTCSLWSSAADRAFRKYFSTESPDLIHAHEAIYAGYATALYCSKNNLPFIITEHSSAQWHGNLSTYKREISDFAYRHSSKNFAVSHRFAEYLTKRYNVLFDYIPNVLDPQYENRVLNFETLTQKKEEFIFLTVATFRSIKDHHTLLTAFKYLSDNYPDARLHLAGDGPLEQKLQATAAMLGITAKVAFLGLLNREQVAVEYLRSDALVVSSLAETFGVVLIEALCFGLPLIATKCGGPESIVTKHNGVLVSLQNPDELAEAMRFMITNQHQFNKKTLHEEAIAKYGGQAFAKHIKQILTNNPGD